MTIKKLIDKHYDKLFDEILKHGEDFYDLVIEYKDLYNGTTIRRSWLDREKRLQEQEF